jgi:pimeloyl-ACP methyl ester carboxylesterase
MEVGGLRLRYLDTGADAGDDRLPVLVIPGHTARIEGFEAFLPALGSRRTIVVDLPGSGESDKPLRRYDLRFYEDTLLRVLDRLEIDQAVPVGGSLGGNLVLRLGHRAPERFPLLALWAPGSAWTAKPALAAVTDRLGTGRVGGRLLGRALFWPVVRVQSRYWYHPDHPGKQQDLDDTFAYYRRVLSPGFVAMYWGMAADQLRRSLFPIAPEIGQPTLLMWGDQDDGAGMGAGVARLRTLLPDVRFHAFPGRRHSLETECPAELAAQVRTFVDDHDPGAP